MNSPEVNQPTNNSEAERPNLSPGLHLINTAYNALFTEEQNGIPVKNRIGMLRDELLANPDVTKEDLVDFAINRAVAVELNLRQSIDDLRASAQFNLEARSAFAGYRNTTDNMLRQSQEATRQANQQEELLKKIRENI
jgi:hypothetical protein